jgi:hypothetical protein
MVIFSGILFCDKYIGSGRRSDVMKKFLKGTAVVAGLTVINIVVNVICNINGIDLDSTANTVGIALCAVFIYEKWTKNEK